MNNTTTITRNRSGKQSKCVESATYDHDEQTLDIVYDKAASEIYAPIAGEVVEVNAALVEDPALANRAPEGEGWFFKLKAAGADTEGLMDRAAYDAFLETIA